MWASLAWKSPDVFLDQKSGKSSASTFLISKVSSSHQTGLHYPREEPRLANKISLVTRERRVRVSRPTAEEETITETSITEEQLTESWSNESSNICGARFSAKFNICSSPRLQIKRTFWFEALKKQRWTLSSELVSILHVQSVRPTMAVPHVSTLCALHHCVPLIHQSWSLAEFCRSARVQLKLTR